MRMWLGREIVVAGLPPLESELKIEIADGRERPKSLVIIKLRNN